MAKRFDCRQYYKDYYEIDFGEDFVIHHMDFDSKNNDINNLLLLPKKLYSRYMFILSGFKAKRGVVNINFEVKIDAGSMHIYDYKMAKMLCETMEEINKWVKKKSDMDMAKHYEAI